jgi:uncharacterized protein
MATISPFSHPLYVMLKPAGARCNLRCKYCYYLEKELLYPDDKVHTMSDELLEKFIREYIDSQTTGEVLFTWHGGETLLRQPDFYRKAVALQKKYGSGRHIANCIQTNGTLLTDEWCHFFRENHWLVGVSIDGPQTFHDHYRMDRHGMPSFQHVMQGIELLNKYGVDWNAMAVVNDYNGDHPLEFYHFFKDIGCHYLQFTPVVERSPDGNVTSFSVNAQQWGNFICTLFDEWVKEDVGVYFVQLFDATLANWMGVTPGVCTMGRSCGHAGVMEYNGDVYACDHFVFPEYKLGNIRTNTLVEMMYSPRQQAFGQAKHTTLPRQCQQCPYLFACNGECPKNRFVQTADGEKGLNYLCEGYRKFFKHVAPYMDYMKNELLNQRPPSNVMKVSF